MTERTAFLLYFGLRLTGVLLCAGGVWLLGQDWFVTGGIAVAAGAATLLVRPRHLGLTTRR